MKSTPISFRLKTFAIGVIALSSASFVAAGATIVPTPNLFWDFNSSTGDDGEIVSSTGSASMDLTMYQYNAAAVGSKVYVNSLGASGSGVSGLSTDRALDLSAATGMGGTTNFGGGAAGTSLAGVAGFSGAISMTIAGWYYVVGEAPINSNSNLVSTSASEKGFRVVGNTNSRLQLYYGGEGYKDSNGNASSKSFSSATNGPWAATGEWIFFATTIEITDTQTLVRFYSGAVDGEVTSRGQTTYTHVVDEDEGILELGDFVPGTAPLTIGNFANASTSRPFKGYIDNIGLWASATDASGALTLSQLEALRMSQIQPIPEPGHIGLVGMGALLLAWKMASFRRRGLVGLSKA